MLKDYRVQTIVGIWGGILFFGVGYLVSGMPQPLYASSGTLIMAGAYLLFVSGCFMYAKGKGQPLGLGFFGILGPLGLLLLYLFKDKSKMFLKKKQKELDNS